MQCGHLLSNGCSSSERHISAVLRFTRNTKTSSGTQPFPGNKSIVSKTEFYRTQASARANDRAGAKMMMCMYASRLHIAIEIVCTHRFVSFKHTCMQFVSFTHNTHLQTTQHRNLKAQIQRCSMHYEYQLELVHHEHCFLVVWLK